MSAGMKAKDKQLLSGDKFAGRHTTFIEAAVPLLKAAKAHFWVDKIVLGPITPCKAGQMHLKFEDSRVGVTAILRGPRAIQEFYITTKNKDWVKEDLTKAVLDH